MIKEAEEFAAQDEAHRHRAVSLNSLSDAVYSLKNQLEDKSGLGGKVRNVVMKSAHVMTVS